MTKKTRNKKPMDTYRDLARSTNKKHRFKAIIIFVGIVFVLIVAVIIVAIHFGTQAERIITGSDFDYVITKVGDEGSGYRLVVGREEISPYMFQATVATEDEDFYSHSEGVNGDETTLTQKLIMITYFPDAQSLSDVDREKLNALATELEKMYTKDEIVTLYLNNSRYDGNRTPGIEHASRTYFDKSAKDLDLAESALFAAMANNPDITLEELSMRKNEVLDKMVKLGYASADEAEEAKAVNASDLLIK